MLTKVLQFERTSCAVALVAATFVTLQPAAYADAKKHAPSTGLAPINFNRPAPDFGFPNGDGPSRLAALRGKPVVINFWATFCEPCLDELGAFAQLNKTYGDGVPLLEISDQTLDVTQPLLKDRGVEAIGVADIERKIFDRYGVTPIPTTLVIAPDGTVTYVSVGGLDWPELQAAVQKALEKPAAGPSS